MNNNVFNEGNEISPGDFDYETVLALKELIERTKGSRLEVIWKAMLDSYLTLSNGDKFKFVENISTMINAVVDPMDYMMLHSLEYFKTHQDDVMKYVLNDEKLRNQIYEQVKANEQNMIQMNPNFLTPMSRSYPYTLIDANCKDHQFIMLSSSKFMMEINDSCIRFSPYIVSHMLALKEFYTEKISLNLKGAISNGNTEVEQLNGGIVRDRISNDYPYLGVRDDNTNDIYLNFGMIDNQALTVAVSIYKISSAESFKLYCNDGSYYINKEDTNQIISSFITRNIRGKYLCQYLEGTNFYACNVINNEETQGTNYKVY